MLPILSLLLQALLFVTGVYIEKLLRKSFLSRDTGKAIKLTTRIITCAIVTTAILLYNYNNVCAPSINFKDCFYLHFKVSQIIHVIIANSILFGIHIYQKFIMQDIDFERYTIKSLFVAPLLQELLFRACFFRTSENQIPTFLLSLIFSISHLHKPIRKELKGKDSNWKRSIGQVIFTFVFGVYSFYFLSVWQSVIPSIVLHCYCNFLGPPSIRKDNIKSHTGCIIGMVLYCILIIR